MNRSQRGMTERSSAELGVARLPSLDLWDGSASPRLPSGLLDLRRIALFLRRNLIRVVVIAALVAALGVTACLLLLNSFSATALVMVDPRDAKVTQTPDVLANIGPDTIAVESLVQVANSDGFLGRVVDRLDLMSDPDLGGKGATAAERHATTVEKLRGGLKIARLGTTYVIGVTATAKNPDRSALIANTVAGMVVDDQSRLRSGSTTDAAAFLDDKLDALRQRLHTAETATAALKAKLNITDAGQGSTLQERRISELTQQLVLAGARAAEAKARFDEVKAAGGNAANVLPASLQTAVLSALRQDYARLTRQVAEQGAIYGDRYPEVQSLKAQVTDLKRQIAAEVGRMVASTRTDAQEASARLTTLNAALAAAQADSGRQGNDRVKLDEIDREAKADRAVYEQLLDRQKQLSELRGLQPSDIRIVSSALPPAQPSRPKLPVLLVAFSTLGLLAGLALAIMREAFRGTVVTRSQAEKLIGVEVAGIVPRVAPRAERGAGMPAMPPDIGPWMDDLRRVAAPRVPGQCRVVLVTSARSGEGKTVLSRNLARSLAQGGDRVLLIEASTPDQTLAPPRFGLLDIVSQECGPERGFVDMSHLGYTRLPFGRLQIADPGSLDGMLGTARLSKAIRHCRSQFDSIVIDGPAVFEAGYATTLAASADLSLMVIEWDSTDSAEVSKALDRLRPDYAALVFNKVNLDRYAGYETDGIERLRRGRASRLVANVA